jgi:hypothetical protein
MRTYLLWICGFICVAQISVMADVPYAGAVTQFGIKVNNVTGGVGFEFTNSSGTSVVVTQLGRWVISGNDQVHVLSIYNSTANQVAAVTINCSGAPTNQFLYATLSAPYTIAPGATVYFLSSEVTGGDTWYNNNNTVFSTGSPSLGAEQSAYLIGSTLSSAGNNGGSFTSAGPVTFQFTSPSPDWTKSGTVYTTDGSQYSVSSAIADASPGDTVNVPAGTFTWGAFSTPLSINKAIVLAGAGPATCIVNIPASAPIFGNGAISLSAPAVIHGITINQPGTGNTTAISTGSTNGWRITNVVYNSGPIAGYFVYASSYGLIDNCTINGGSGSDEFIFGRGPANSWQTASSLGSANAVYVENCTFNLQGYMDFNSNARAVIRFCTFNPSTNYIKIDGHGYTTNTPARSFREIEAYNNTWTVGESLAIEIRGGSGVIFNNTNLGSAAFYLTDYGYQTNQTNYGHYVTAFNYPLIDQVGVGEDPIAAASEPAYVFGNVASGTAWPRAFHSPGAPSSYNTNASGYPVGSTTITLTSLNSGGGGNGVIGIGDAVAFAGDSHRYVVTSGVAFQASLPTTITIASPGLQTAIPASASVMTSGAQTLYQQQTGNAAASFTEANVIQSNRDFFADAGFDTNTGVSVGTTAQMNALTPSIVGYGFWVTDQGSWNTTVSPNTSGLLYKWSGTAWVLYYTPYTYPNPLRRPISPSGLNIGP